MKARFIDWGLSLFGMRGKLAGYQTKFGVAASALLVVSGLIIALVKSFMLAEKGLYGQAIVSFFDSVEFKGAVLLFTGTKMIGGTAMKQDKNTGAMLALEAGKPELAKAIAGGNVSPLVIIPPPEGSA